MARPLSDGLDRNRSVALFHANLLQDRKNVENTVFESLITLIDYPTTENASPAAPSTTDLANFRRMIQPFQVSDYDSLLEERNLGGSCAYVFCPRPPAAERRKSGIVKIVGFGRDSRIVPTRDVRKWCSVDCARRAMFIKVQLSETPGWERAGGNDKQVEVLEEVDDQALAEKMNGLNMEGGGGEEDLMAAFRELALERGEKQNSARKAAMLQPEVVEKEISRPPQPPNSACEGASWMIDGYTPSSSRAVHGAGAGDEDDEDDDNDTDWVM